MRRKNLNFRKISNCFYDSFHGFLRESRNNQIVENMIYLRLKCIFSNQRLLTVESFLGIFKELMDNPLEPLAEKWRFPFLIRKKTRTSSFNTASDFSWLEVVLQNPSLKKLNHLLLSDPIFIIYAAATPERGEASSGSYAFYQQGQGAKYVLSIRKAPDICNRIRRRSTDDIR